MPALEIAEPPALWLVAQTPAASNWQQAIVLCVLGLAAAHIAWRGWKAWNAFHRNSASGCGGCHGCAKNAAAPLVSIDIGPK